jgi:hypothetical protein
VSWINVGTVGGGAPAHVDTNGTVRPPGAGWTLEWWIGADDRWRLPTNEVAVRQHRVGDAPVVETAMRVPSGDAVQRVYGAAGDGTPLVIEVENASPAPFVLALVVRGASQVAVEGVSTLVDRQFVLTTSRAPSRWAKSVSTPVQIPVTTGHAQTGPFPAARDRGARLEVALLHPVAHRTTVRAVLTAGKGAPAVDPRTMPDAADVARGWARVLDRAMRVELPSDALTARVQAARADVLLAAQARSPGAPAFAALEDWGFDLETAAAWRRLSARERHAVRTRPAPGTWEEAETLPDDAEFLVAVRRLLVDDGPARPVGLLAAWPEAWRGQPLAVHDAPIVGGLVSYALRWHGPRAAFLWETTAPDVTLRVPGLDPEWSTTEARGEALLEVPERSA